MSKIFHGYRKTILNWLSALCIVFPILGNSQQLNGTKAIDYSPRAQNFSIAPDPEWARSIVAPKDEKPNESIVIIFADAQLHFSDQGEGHSYFHLAMRANSNVGLSQIGQISLEYNPEYQHLVLHQLKVIRGKSVIDKLNTTKVRFLERELGLENSIYTGTITASILLDDIGVGDTIEYAYSVVGTNPVFKGKIADSLSWQSTSSVQLRRAIIRFPQSRPVRYQFIGDDSVPKNAAVQNMMDGGYRELRLEQKNVPPLRVENDYAFGYQPYVWLQISEYKNWNELALWAADLFSNHEIKSTDLIKQIAEWRKIPNPEKRATAALQYVQSEIRYTSVSFGENSHRPANPDEVVHRRYGDCKDKTQLLIAIYKSLGLSAAPVLASIKNHHNFRNWLPSHFIFDHAIVKLELKGKTHWLDPTLIQNPVNLATLGHPHDGKEVLVAINTTTLPAKIEYGEPNLYRTEEQISDVDTATGSAHMKQSVTWTSNDAENVRLYIASVSREELQKSVLNEVQKNYGVSSIIGDIDIKNDFEKNEVSINTNLIINNYAQRTEGGWLLRHEPSSIASKLRTPEMVSRMAPYAIPYPSKIIFIHEVTIPKNTKSIAEDDVTSISNDYFSAKQIITSKAEKTRFDYEYQAHRQQVAPKDMPRYIEDLRKAQRELHPILEISPKKNDAIKKDSSNTSSSEFIEAMNGNPEAQYELGLKFYRGEGMAKDIHEAAVWMNKSAVQGLPKAQYLLAAMYSDGLGVERNDSQAFSWYEKAAAQGIIEATYEVGLRYAKGRGVHQDWKEAYSWYKRSADSDYPPALHDLAIMHLYGFGIPKNEAEGAALMRRAAEKNLAPAQTFLGKLIADGKVLPQDYREALIWFRRAAVQNDAEGQLAIGLMYASGQGVPQDYSQAIEWISKASDQELASAQFSLGLMHYEGKGTQKDLEKALSLWMKSAKAGHPSAQNYVAYAYEVGEGVAKDSSEARSWYEKSAAQGNSGGMYRLSRFYMQGLGVEKDPKRAIELLRQAADQGNYAAQNDLGLAYESGKGVTTNFFEAANWYRKAADQGNSTAQRNLGLLYARGRGVPLDPVEAHKWLNLAAADGIPGAAELRDQVAEKMSSKQVADAQKLAREWHPQR